MQTYLDIRTLAFLTGILCFIVFLSMLFVLRTRKTYPGFQRWTLAAFLGFFGFILLSLQGFFPDFLTIIAANTIIIGSSFFLVYGLETFAGRTPKLWWYISPFVLMFILLVHFTHFFPNVTARVIITAILYMLLFGVCAILVYRDIPLLLQSSNWMLVLTFSSLVCLNGLRIVGTLLFEFHKKSFLVALSHSGDDFRYCLVRNYSSLCGADNPQFPKS